MRTIQRFGERCRDRFRISSWCLTSTDSATTARVPPGPASRAMVVSRCRSRMAKSRTVRSYQHDDQTAEPSRICEFAMDRVSAELQPTSATSGCSQRHLGCPARSLTWPAVMAQAAGGVSRGCNKGPAQRGGLPRPPRDPAVYLMLFVVSPLQRQKRFRPTVRKSAFNDMRGGP